MAGHQAIQPDRGLVINGLKRRPLEPYEDKQERE
jgi:hypothetical protein